MKVKNLLGILNGNSTIERVSLRKFGVEVEWLNKHCLESDNYMGRGDSTVLTFSIIGNELILNLKP